MPIKVSVCKGGDVQNWWVPLFLRGREHTAEGIMTGIKRAKGCFTQDWRVWFPFVSDFFFFWSGFYLIMWKALAFECMQISMSRSKTICIWSLDSGCWKARTICRVEIWTWSATAQENGDKSFPGFVEVLYFNSVSLPTLLQAQFTPLLSPKRKGNRGDKDVPRGVTNLYPSGVFKDSHLY